MKDAKQIAAELKACPFCGGVAELDYVRYHGTAASGMETPCPRIGCRFCNYAFPRTQCDETPWGRANGKPTIAQATASAIAAWNQRAELEASDADR